MLCRFSIFYIWKRGTFFHLLFAVNVILKSSMLTAISTDKQHCNYLYIYMFSVLVKMAEYNSKSLIFAVCLEHDS